MKKNESVLINREQFESLAASYKKRWKADLSVVDANGKVRFGTEAGCSKNNRNCDKLRCKMLEETLRWGDVTAEFCSAKKIIWAVPLLINTKMVGGVIASVSEEKMFPNGQEEPAFDFQAAADDLRQRLEEMNLTNGPLLEIRRAEYLRERRRAQAIHAYKAAIAVDFRSIYLREEPALMAAIRKGDREEARGVLNSILTALHHQAGERLDLIKSFFLELVTLMCRTAVEAGGDPSELLGANYECFTALSKMRSEEQLGPWVHDILERLIDAIHRHRRATPTALIHSAIVFMQDNLAEEISRDDAAKAAHLSPAHFSRIFKTELGRSFTELLNQMRVDRAAELLARTNRSLCLIALDCGFRDQSYFTKVFRRLMKMTPREYRLRCYSEQDRKKA